MTLMKIHCFIFYSFFCIPALFLHICLYGLVRTQLVQMGHNVKESLQDFVDD